MLCSVSTHSLSRSGCNRLLCSNDAPDGVVLNKMTGTPAFMAPEVFERSFGRPADMWSLGVLAYQALSNRCFTSCAVLLALLLTLLSDIYLSAAIKLLPAKVTCPSLLVRFCCLLPLQNVQLLHSAVRLCCLVRTCQTLLPSSLQNVQLLHSAVKLAAVTAVTIPRWLRSMKLEMEGACMCRTCLIVPCCCRLPFWSSEDSMHDNSLEGLKSTVEEPISLDFGPWLSTSPAARDLVSGLLQVPTAPSPECTVPLVSAQDTLCLPQEAHEESLKLFLGNALSAGLLCAMTSSVFG